MKSRRPNVTHATEQSCEIKKSKMLKEVRALATFESSSI